MQSQEQFDRFFREYSKNVDRFDEADYWKLSDEVIRLLLKKYLPSGPEITILDAGGGTGRWAIWCRAELVGKVVVLDKSLDMLAKAEYNVRQAEMVDSISLMHGDLHNEETMPRGPFDACISIYNVLSFLSDPAQCLRNIVTCLKPGGLLVVMGQGFYNALSSKISTYTDEPSRLQSLNETHVVCWKEGVPPLRVYSAAELRHLLTAVGLEVVAIHGVTTLVAPGPEDFTFPYTEMSTISQALQNRAFFETCCKLEMMHNGEVGIADRGVNLLAVGRK